MAEATNELIAEVLKAMQDRMSRMDVDLDEVHGEFIAVRGYMCGAHQDVGNICPMLAKHDVRLDHIERCLGLVEPAL